MGGEGLGVGVDRLRGSQMVGRRGEPRGTW